MRNASSIVLFAILTSGCAAQSGPLLTRVADVPLPGGATRFDYQSFDPQTGRLYVAHTGDGALVVFDTRAGTVVASLAEFPKATGVRFVPQLRRVYVSAAGAHEVVAVDAESLKITKRIAGGKFPDGLAWSPETHKLFVSDEAGEVEVVIDTDKDERVATIEMGGEVGNTQYDPTSHLVYACVQSRDQLVAIDAAKNAIVARYDLPGGRHPHGLHVDDAHRKAYIACEGNARPGVASCTEPRKRTVTTRPRVPPGSAGLRSPATSTRRPTGAHVIPTASPSKRMHRREPAALSR